MYKPEKDCRMNPCIKTGCTALVEGSEIFHGDLFDFGHFLMLNCSAPGSTVPEEKINGLIHLTAFTWQQRLQQNHVIIFAHDHITDFNYGGRMHSKGLVVTA